MHSRLELATTGQEHCDLGDPAKAIESGSIIRAISLLVVLIFAKGLVLWDRDLPLSVWTPFAYLWQDLLLVLAVAVLDRLCNRERLGWIVYGLLLFYTALNVPLVRILSTPMTWPMLRGTRGALADSITHYVTWSNVFLIVSVILVGIGLPRLCRAAKRRWLWIGGVVFLPLILLGPWADGQIDTNGLHRNSVIVLLTSPFPRVKPEPADSDWRRSPFGQTSGESLAEFRGRAADHNVILIILESAGTQYLRPYGASEDPMPHLTELSHKAILFEQAYTVYPESIKGLMAVLSSVYPAMDTTAEQYKTIGRRSLADELARSKYQTALFHSGRFMYLGMEYVVREHGFEKLEDAGDISGIHHSSFGVDEPSTVSRMLAWIDGDETDSRFFITYMPIAGHHPYETPEPGPFREEDEIDSYRNALHYCDAAIGQLLDGLQQRGLDQNTMLVIVGDHGQAFGQHEGNYGHTFFLYEENVRIPLMFVLPSLDHSVSVGGVASSIDVAPTVLELLGKESPKNFQGQSLLEPDVRMALFFTDYSLGLIGLRDRNWKFIYELESGRAKLFDLNSDPAEQHNLASENPDRVGRFRDHVRRWIAAQRAVILGREKS